jgi:hypothetical protein
MTDPAQIPLRDIHLPDAVSWWPLAAGWWLTVAALLLIACAAWWWLAKPRRRRDTELRRIAASEMDRLLEESRGQYDAARILQELSVLLRRIAMTFGGRDRVAGLCGEDWVRWLEATDVRGALDAHSLKLLAAAPYRRAGGAAGHDVDGLISACRRWLCTFDPEAGERDPV